jgi:cell division protein ZapA
MTAKPGAADDSLVTLDVSLLGRDYKVSCKESERTELLDAVAFLDRRMREIRDAGKIAGSERIAVMAALNMAHELQRARADTRAPRHDPATASAQRPAGGAIDGGAARRRIVAMQSAIEQALAGNEKLS